MAHSRRPQSQPKYDPHYAAIGRLAETWAHLEFAIDQAIWQLAHVEQAFGACITSQLIGVNRRIRAYRALFRANNGDEKLDKRIGTFAGDLGSLQIERDRAVHDPRMINTRTEIMDRLQVTADHKLVFEWRPETPESLMETREKIGAKILQFQDLHVEICDALSASLKKQPLRLPQISYMTAASDPATDPE